MIDGRASTSCPPDRRVVGADAQGELVHLHPSGQAGRSGDGARQVAIWRCAGGGKAIATPDRDLGTVC